MCLKVSILLRSFTVVFSLIIVSFVEASLRRVQKNGQGEEGCYFNFPNRAVCDYAVGIGVLNVVVAVFFVILDCIIGVRRHGGKRFKKVDYVVCIVFTLAWVACGGTMAGFDADLTKSERNQFKDDERQFADGMVTISWITCVTWVVILILVACSDGPPQEVHGLMVDSPDYEASHDDSKPLLPKH